ncbi:MAG TPA: N-methyl-L-tryptophan oxidase [Candidatus Eisenbacteria bacterium]
MNVPTYDVAIVGLGAMGGAAAFHLARRGTRVLGLDRFAPPHALGSSHGETRIIREAYFEDPRYVPIVQRAYELWRELEKVAGERLLIETGGLMVGPPDGVVVGGAKASADTHRLPYEWLEAAALRRRFPALTPDDDTVAVWEPRAGALFPEACVRAHLALAADFGADLRMDEAVLSWRPDGGGYEVTTSRGRHRASRLVLAANAWLPRLLPGVSLPLTVTRQPLFWFANHDPIERLAPGRLPVYIWERGPDLFFYGFPAFDGELKVARHMGGRASDPDAIDRTVGEEESGPHRAFLDACIPGASGAFRRGVVCMYANTPDGHFVIDRHPEHAEVLILSACSGHGFKFSCAIGEIAAQLLLEGDTPHDLGLFRLRW